MFRVNAHVGMCDDLAVMFKLKTILKQRGETLKKFN